MKVTLRVSTGAKVVVWREQDAFHAHALDRPGDTQICLAVDLFEVIAELSGLDLHNASQSDEAIALADRAQRRLADHGPLNN